MAKTPRQNYRIGKQSVSSHQHVPPHSQAFATDNTTGRNGSFAVFQFQTEALPSEDATSVGGQLAGQKRPAFTAASIRSCHDKSHRTTSCRLAAGPSARFPGADRTKRSDVPKFG